MYDRGFLSSSRRNPGPRVSGARTAAVGRRAFPIQSYRTSPSTQATSDVVPARSFVNGASCAHATRFASWTSARTNSMPRWADPRASRRHRRPLRQRERGLHAEQGVEGQDRRHPQRRGRRRHRLQVRGHHRPQRVRRHRRSRRRRRGRGAARGGRGRQRPDRALQAQGRPHPRLGADHRRRTRKATSVTRPRHAQDQGRPAGGHRRAGLPARLARSTSAARATSPSTSARRSTRKIIKIDEERTQHRRLAAASSSRRSARR